MSLKDTLGMLLEQEKRAKQAAQERQKAMEEWKQAVAALMTNVRGYSEEYEKDGSLSFSNEDTIRLTEEGLGAYEIPVMKINAGSAAILIQPLGREINGTLGSVNMQLQERTAERQRVMLLRMPTSGTNSPPTWLIRIPRQSKTFLRRLRSRGRTLPFTKSTLEQAIEFLLG